MIKKTIPTTWIYLGKVVRPHGIKGGLLVKLVNAASKSLRPGIQVHFRLEKGTLKSFEVISFTAGRLLQIKGLEDRNVAETYVRSEVFIDRSDFPELKDNEIYLNDMLGFEVLSTNGDMIGEVTGFSDNTAQVLIEVKVPSGASAFIPYVKPLVQKVDTGARVIIVDLPLGLIESEASDD